MRSLVTSIFLCMFVTLTAELQRRKRGLEFAKSQRAEENRKMEETGYEVVCGASMTLAVNGQAKEEY